MDIVGWAKQKADYLRPPAEDEPDIEAPTEDDVAASADEKPVLATTPRGIQGEKGISGLRSSAGRIRREYNDSLATLSDRMQVFDEMRKSDTACASLETLLSLPIRETEWWVEPGDFPDAADQIAKNLGVADYSGTMTSSFDDLLREALLGPLYGFALHEKVFEEKPGGWLGWRKFAERDRATVNSWKFDDTGGLAGLEQIGYEPGGTGYRTVEFDSMDKLILWTWRREAGDPEGLGMLRQAFKAYMYKSAFEEFAAIRIERQAMGIPTATGPKEGYTEAEAERILELMGRLRTGAETGLIAPEGWDLDMLTLGPADVPFESHLEREHQYILQSGAAGFVGLGQGGDTGAWALSRDLSSIFMLMLNAVADWMVSHFNRYAIEQIMNYNINGIEGANLPRLAHGSIAVRDPRVFAEALKIIYDPKLEIPEDVEATFRHIMGLRDPGAAKRVKAEMEDNQPELTRVEDTEEAEDDASEV